MSFIAICCPKNSKDIEGKLKDGILAEIRKLRISRLSVEIQGNFLKTIETE